MLKFKNTKGQVVLIEHDDGTIEILDEELFKEKIEIIKED